jgi:hypothetical protein
MGEKSIPTSPATLGKFTAPPTPITLFGSVLTSYGSYGNPSVAWFPGGLCGCKIGVICIPATAPIAPLPPSNPPLSEEGVPGPLVGVDAPEARPPDAEEDVAGEETEPFRWRAFSSWAL